MNPHQTTSDHRWRLPKRRVLDSGLKTLHEYREDTIWSTAHTVVEDRVGNIVVVFASFQQFQHRRILQVFQIPLRSKAPASDQLQCLGTIVFRRQCLGLEEVKQLLPGAQITVRELERRTSRAFFLCTIDSIAQGLASFLEGLLLHYEQSMLLRGLPHANFDLVCAIRLSGATSQYAIAEYKWRALLLVFAEVHMLIVNDGEGK